jgi:GT2 family glycosyltransferase
VNAPRVSFIVPVKNDEKRLARCLQSIRRNFGAQRCEIIVVDHGSTDGSVAVAHQHGATLVSVTEAARVSELRNRGVRHATGGVLAFVDADNEIVAGWAVAALESLHLPGAGAVGAAYLPPIDGTWVQRAYGALRGRSRGRHDTDWLGSGNLAVWRTAFEAIGGFDTTLDTCEDVDFCQRLRTRGFRVLSDERLKSVHHGDPATLRTLFKAERWRGRNNVRVSFRRPVSWAAVPTAVIAIVDLMMLGLLIAGVLMLPAIPRMGATLILLAAVVFVALAWLRVARVVVREKATRTSSVLQVLAVVCVYDLARALALVTRAPHRTAASATPAVAS